MSENKTSSTMNPSNKFKEQGNEYFKLKEYDQAIIQYSKAIVKPNLSILMIQELNDSNPAFYLNRAKCFKMKRDFQKQYNDSLLAIELDDTYIKAYMVHGEALVELGKTDTKSSARIEKGIQRLKKALGMCF